MRRNGFDIDQVLESRPEVETDVMQGFVPKSSGCRILKRAKHARFGKYLPWRCYYPHEAGRMFGPRTIPKRLYAVLIPNVFRALGGIEEEVEVVIGVFCQDKGTQKADIPQPV